MDLFSLVEDHMIIATEVIHNYLSNDCGNGKVVTRIPAYANKHM